MVKLSVMYNPPPDPEAFDTYYMTTHVPLVEKIPGLRRFEVSKSSSPDGSPPAFYAMGELYFDSAEAMAAGLDSAEGKAAIADGVNFAGAGVTALTSEVLRDA
jgi:uncharacterized protein (TIGR02118 family)